MPEKTEQRSELPTVGDVKTRIHALGRMKDLPIEAFATEQGYAYAMARVFGRDLKATQLRKFFAAIKETNRYTKRRRSQQLNNDQDGKDQKLDAETRAKLMLIMPTLAYAKARNLIPNDFYEIVRDCMNEKRLQDADDLDRLAQFMESLVAYHKLFEKSGGH